MAAAPSAPPSTARKLTAQAAGTAFLGCLGAGFAATAGVIRAGTGALFSMAVSGATS